MAQIAKAKKSVEKKSEYAKKVEQKGTNVVLWIIGALIVLGLCYAAWSIYFVS